MINEIRIFQYDGHDIEFQLSAKMMINATEMGRIFSKQPSDYTRLDRSKAFIAECFSWAKQDNEDPKKTGISPFIGVKSENDLVKKTQKTGTWMNRIVALDFAAWLDPRFGVWMYMTVDRALRNPGQPQVSSQNKAERKQLLQTIRADEASLQAYEEQKKQIDIFHAAEETRERLTKNRKRLKALDREVVTQFNLFVDQEEPVQPSITS